MAKRGTLEHPKNRRLARALKTIPCFSLGILEAIWHKVAQFHWSGRVSRLDLDEIFDTAGLLQLYDIDKLIVALSSPDSRWLDQLPDGSYYVHDWHDHCEDSVHAKLYREVEFFANGVAPSPKKIGQAEREQLAPQWQRAAAKVTREAAETTTSAAKPTTSAAGNDAAAKTIDSAAGGSLKGDLPCLAKPSHASPSPRARTAAEPDAHPKRRVDLGQALMLPPLVLEAMRAYTPQLQADAWEILQAFIAYSPGSRSTQKLGEMAARFADALVARPEAKQRLLEYFAVSDPKQIEQEFVAGKRLRPGASPWEICDSIYPPEKPADKPPAPCQNLAKEKAKTEAAKKNPVSPEQFREMREAALKRRATA